MFAGSHLYLHLRLRLRVRLVWTIGISRCVSEQRGLEIIGYRRQPALGSRSGALGGRNTVARFKREG